MKIINYLYNLCRLGYMKSRHRYEGIIIQGIPASTQIIVETGTLLISGKLSCRRNCYINAETGCLKIGEGCFLNEGVHIVSKVKIILGKNVIIGPNVVIVDHDHDYRDPNRKTKFTADPILIGDDVWIGANSVIMRGTVVGNGSVIGAGTVLKGTYPENSMIYQEKKTKVTSIKGDKCV